MGSPAFAVPSLNVLAGSHHEIAAVVTQPDRPSGRSLQMHAPAVKVEAQNHGLRILQPASTRAPGIVADLAALKPDLLVVVAYGEILRPAVLQLSPHGAVNLHASLLPRHRGAAPIAWAILSGDTETGATTMRLNEAMDAGPVFLQQSCSILESDTTESLSLKIAELGAPLLKRTLDLIEKGELVPTPQDAERVTYAPKLKKEDGRLDWNKPALYLARQIRAFQPWPGSYCLFRGQTLKFWSAHPAPESTTHPPGTVASISRNSFQVVSGNGSLLEVFEVQPQNRSRLSAADFIHGYRLSEGDVMISSTFP